METKIRRLDHKSLVALMLVITRVIKADSRIDAEEIRQLSLLEQQYGFDRTLMPEASRLTLSAAVAQLRTLELPLREQIMKSLTTLASSDRILERHEAMLLLSLRYCLLGNDDLQCDIISCHSAHRGGDLGTYILYYESEKNVANHQQLDEQAELIGLMLQQNGLQLFHVEQIVKSLCEQDEAIIRKMLGYLSPTLNDAQVDNLYQRVSQMDTKTFCQQILVRSMELNELRALPPSLLINLGTTDFLRIQISQPPLTHIRQFLNDFNLLASPHASNFQPHEHDHDKGHFCYYSYYRDFFNLLVQAEPIESRVVLWPNKSEFEFPDAGRTLRLNQQEASLYTLILVYTYNYNKQGLPLSYTAAQRQIEALYRSIYCRKKFIETEDVIFPDNLAPIRAKIEKKMRDQLADLENIEDFIPRNENREGFYRIAAPSEMVKIRPDSRSKELSIEDFKW